LNSVERREKREERREKREERREKREERREGERRERKRIIYVVKNLYLHIEYLSIYLEFQWR
jgi:hypothetical protein